MFRKSVLLFLSIAVSIGSMIMTAPDADAQLFRRLRAQRQAAAQAQLRQPQPNYNQQRYNQQLQQQQRAQAQSRIEYPPSLDANGNRRLGRSNVATANYPSGVAASGTPTGPTLAEMPEPAESSSTAGSSSTTGGASERADNFDDSDADSPVAPALESKKRLDSEQRLDSEKRFGQSILSRSADERSDDSASVKERVKERPSRSATMGLNVFYTPSSRNGVRIAGMTQRSMADESGLQIGDLIVEVDQQRIRRSEDLAAVLRLQEPGNVLPVKFVRNNVAYITRVPLVASMDAPRARPPIGNEPAGNEPAGNESTTRDRVAAAKPPITLPAPASAKPLRSTDPLPSNSKVKLGMMIQDPTSLRGTMVSSVRPNSIADAAGMKEGDRIVSVEGKLLENGSRLRDYVSQLTWGDSLAVGVVRDGELISRRIDLVQPESKLAESSAAETPTNNQPESASEVSEAENQPSTASSIGKGIGSMLGGLFGASRQAQDAGNDNESLDAAASNLAAIETEPTADVETQNDLPIPVEQPVQQVSGVENETSSVWDPLGFGDDEPIEQSIFKK